MERQAWLTSEFERNRPYLRSAAYPMERTRSGMAYQGRSWPDAL